MLKTDFESWLSLSSAAASFRNLDMSEGQEIFPGRVFVGHIAAFRNNYRHADEF